MAQCVADAALCAPPRSVPGSIFEGDGEADRAGVYRRSHAAKYYEESEDRLVSRAAVPEFVSSPNSALPSNDFTVKVVNGVAVVVARGPGDAAELEAAALKSESLLVAPLKGKLKGKGADLAPERGEIQPAAGGGSASSEILLQSATPAEAGRRKGKFTLE